METSLQPFLLQEVGLYAGVSRGLVFLLRFPVSVLYDDAYHSFCSPTLVRLTFQLCTLMAALVITFQHFWLEYFIVIILGKSGTFHYALVTNV